MTTPDQMWRADPIPAGWRSCEICDHEGLDVRPGMGRYGNPNGSFEYRKVTRCKDAEACQARCEAAGNEWPLA